MKYKTVIEVVTEAKDKSEALDIVGEYLSGEVFSGVHMKYSTRSVNGLKTAAITVTALSILLAVGALSFFLMRPYSAQVPSHAGMSATQPPLQTHALQVSDAQFKAKWQDKHNKEAIRKIKLLNQ